MLVYGVVGATPDGCYGSGSDRHDDRLAWYKRLRHSTRRSWRCCRRWYNLWKYPCGNRGIVDRQSSHEAVDVTNLCRSDATVAKTQGVALAIRTVAADYGVPVLDLSQTSGVNSITAATLLCDRLHPSDSAFSKVIGPAITQLLSPGRRGKTSANTNSGPRFRPGGYL